MTVRVHVGPEYSWDVLHEFLSGAKKQLVSAMYEFHAPQIKDAIEERLDAGISLTMVLDNTSFAKVKDEQEEFDRIPVFEDWAERFHTKFKRIVAPEGKQGADLRRLSHQGHGAGGRHLLAFVRELEERLEPAGHHPETAGRGRRRRPARQPGMARRDQKPDARHALSEPHPAGLQTIQEARSGHGAAEQGGGRHSDRCADRRGGRRGTPAAKQAVGAAPIRARREGEAASHSRPRGGRLFGGGSRTDPLGQEEPAVSNPLYRHADRTELRPRLYRRTDQGADAKAQDL